MTKHGNLTERRPGVWKYSYSVDGQRRYTTIAAPTRRLAERGAAKLYAGALEAKEAAHPRHWKVQDLLRAWLDDHLSELRSDYSRRNYRETVERFWVPLIGSIPLASYSSQHLLAVKRDLIGRLSSETVAHRWQILRQAETWAVRHKYLSESPAALVDVPAGVSAPVQRYSLAEMLALDAVLEPPEGIVIALGLHAGLRIGEARGLRVVDVEVLAHVLHVRQQLVRLPKKSGRTRLPKMYKQRTVELTPLLEAHLAAAGDWHEERGERLQQEDLWGSNLAREPFSASHVYRYLQEAQQRAGVPLLEYHAAGRHTYATIAREAGIPDMHIAANLGHANTSMLVQRYGNHPGQERHAGMREKMAAYLASATTEMEAK